jgi:hypothetical protein
VGLLAALQQLTRETTAVGLPCQPFRQQISKEGLPGSARHQAPAAII